LKEKSNSSKFHFFNQIFSRISFSKFSSFLIFENKICWLAQIEENFIVQVLNNLSTKFSSKETEVILSIVKVICLFVKKLYFDSIVFLSTMKV
jgi:hypothetical protein